MSKIDEIMGAIGRHGDDCIRDADAASESFEGLRELIAAALADAERKGAEVEPRCPECDQRGWHKLSCSQRTDRAPQFPATRDAGGVLTVCQRPCRCGPDGCADPNGACPRR